MGIQINSRIIAVIGTVFFLYALLAVYSMDYFGAGIYRISAPVIPAGNLNSLASANVPGYTLTLKERGNKEEQIRDYEIGLNYDSDWGFGDPEGRQYPSVLSKIFINNEDPRIGAGYDKGLLRERLDSLDCFDENNIIKPKNPILRYSDVGYIIVDEINGNMVDKNILYKRVVDAILTRKAVLDLEDAGCYIKPKYTSKSMEVIKVRDMLSKYVSSQIAYTFGGHIEIIDGSIINKWLIVDGNYEVTFDEEAVKAYLSNLSNKYKAAGMARSFVTSSGNVINISGGDYNWIINSSYEAQEMIAAIRLGENMTKEPAYVQSSYVEIDLTKQHLWFYKDGSLITDGDIVSGNLRWGMPTPEGVYKLYYKQRNAVLRGPGYAAPVDFWMPFNGGIGIHDATWRHAFGGEIYKNDGSHGCINCPYDLAETIFNNIYVGTPVICYY